MVEATRLPIVNRLSNDALVKGDVVWENAGWQCWLPLKSDRVVLMVPTEILLKAPLIGLHPLEIQLVDSLKGGARQAELRKFPNRSGADDRHANAFKTV